MHNTILGLHVTEKASALNAVGKYVFKVRRSASKVEVWQSVEELYGVGVNDVNILNMPSKTRRLGRQIGEKSGYKKAVVTLKSGQKIDIS